MGQQQQEQTHEGTTMNNQKLEPGLKGESPTRERPILFSGAMVRAILDETKTKTRRVVKYKHRLVDVGGALYDADGINPGRLVTLESCPYGAVGDRLWVRETFAEKTSGYRYRADFHEYADTRITFRPSIHMPRRASRLTLEITGIRVERLQCINGHDAWEEGARAEHDAGAYYDSAERVQKYRALWDSLNAKRGFGWDVNPWVWVIEFRRVSA